MLHEMAAIVLLKAGLIKRHNLKEWIFSRTKIFKRKSESWIRFIWLCNKCDSIVTSDFAKKADLANLKSEVDKLNIDKLKNITSNLSNLKKR